ncbi:MAG: 50S ribosomal protein L23 [Candidatus Taylorbacteria bacterium]
MAIFGFKKRKDDKLQQSAVATKNVAAKGAKKHVLVAKKQEGGKKEDIKGIDSKVLITLPAKGIVVPVTSFTNVSEAIIRPRVTEKSGLLSQDGRYTFEVHKNSNKKSIGDAVNALYKVRPIKVTVINMPVKNVFVKGRKGTVPGIRKAIVTLKKGDKIDFV